LDDRLLADIGIPRHQIAEYARKVAHRAVPVAPLPTSGRKTVLARLRSWRERRAAIRELSMLDDRLLRDIGIEPGRVGEVIDAVLSRRRDLDTTHPVVQITEAMQKVLVPVRHRSQGPATQVSDFRALPQYGSRATVCAERTADIHSLRARTANESESPEPRRRALASL
jgi:uncharacterized protein YjiS (DUF1127 family)